jgi:hypothetical protein
MNWFNTSLMLNVDEYISLVNMIKFTNDTLLYRATTHGFEASAFHAKCDGKENTITIIKTNGYSSIMFGSLLSYCGKTIQHRSLKFRRMNYKAGLI